MKCHYQCNTCGHTWSTEETESAECPMECVGGYGVRLSTREEAEAPVPSRFHNIGTDELHEHIDDSTLIPDSGVYEVITELCQRLAAAEKAVEDLRKTRAWIPGGPDA